MWTKEEDGTVVDETGKVIWFSCQRFVADICEGECCFICGAAPGTKPFNAEHVLPDWLLAFFNLHSGQIGLGNGAKYLYGKLTLPCCAECNSLMGERIEDPISEVVKAGTDATLDFIAKGGFPQFYIWMGLIFLKLHLKDRAFRYHLDTRKGDEKISDFHVWEDLHHLHSVVRCFVNGAVVDREAVGSFLTLPVRKDASPDRFDFADISPGQALMLRLDDMAYFAVFNDSGGALNGYQSHLQRIAGGPISEPQAREVLVELAFVNLQTKERPKFMSAIDRAQQTYRIVAARPPHFEMVEPLDLPLRGELLQHALGDFLKGTTFNGSSPEEVREAIRAGHFSVLFDNEGRFIERTNVDDLAKG